MAGLQPSFAQETTGAPPGETQNSAQSSPNPGPEHHQNVTNAPPNSTLDDTMEAGESDEEQTRQFTSWNHYEGPYFTIRFGGGFLVDTAAYAQDQQSKEQFAMLPDVKLRDFRFLLGGIPQFQSIRDMVCRHHVRCTESCLEGTANRSHDCGPQALGTPLHRAR